MSFRKLLGAVAHQVRASGKFLRAHNGVIGAIAGVLGTILALAVYVQMGNENAPKIELASLVIDRPENIEQSVLDSSDGEFNGQIVGKDEEVTYDLDVTLRNKGAQAALITEVIIEFTEAVKPELCGDPPIGGGGGLGLGATYDINFSDTFVADLPVRVVKSTRLEVPAREFTRFAITIGPEVKPDRDVVDIFSFNLYVVEASSEGTPSLLGRGKAVSSVEDADYFIENIPQYAQASASCMESNAEEIARMTELPGVTSPKLIELARATARYRQ